MMVQNITPGFANPEKKLIESSWDVPPFTDIFGNWQDYGSTKEGLDEGLRRGVFEVQPHRAWSHMNWDLDSPPGPWWGSPVDGEMKITDWYNEVVDVRRGHAPVPSNDLLFIYKKGIEAIQKSFGVTPLAAEVRPGAELKEGTPGGDDRRLNVHDNLNWIESRKDKYWMGFNETCAYLHSEISDTGTDGFGINFNYDGHYCKYFEKKQSVWTFEISDNFRHALGTGVSILVDGKPALTGLSASQKIEIPAGLGIHTLRVVNN